MYTQEMGRAFRSLDHFAPKGFSVRVMDNEHFITVVASEQSFMSLDDQGKRQAVEYMARVKKALEENGAIVLLMREGGVEE